MSSQVMRQSAAKADASSTAVDSDDANQFLTFLLSGETYAISILNVKEIIENGDLTRVPMVPDYIRGVLNLRGSVVSVIDLSLRLGKERSEVTRRTCILIVEARYEDEVFDIGVMVDAVYEVLEIDADNIEPPPAFGANIRADFITGMGRVEDKFIVLLNVTNVLSIEELSQLDQMSQMNLDQSAQQQAESSSDVEGKIETSPDPDVSAGDD